MNDDTLSRLAWGLPLVLVMGVAGMLILRRALKRIGLSPASATPMALTHTLRLSDTTQAHLLAIGGQPVLVVESPSGTAIQPMGEAHAGAPRATRLGGRRP